MLPASGGRLPCRVQCGAAPLGFFAAVNAVHAGGNGVPAPGAGGRSKSRARYVYVIT